jgi:hypothetical protein
MHPSWSSRHDPMMGRNELNRLFTLFFESFKYLKYKYIISNAYKGMLMSMTSLFGHN